MPSKSREAGTIVKKDKTEHIFGPRNTATPLKVTQHTV